MSVSGNQSLWVYFADAGPVVKTVMMILIVASIASWTVIFQRGFFLKQAQKAMLAFEDVFWSGIELSKLYTDMNTRRYEPEGLEHLFYSGFKEFARLRKQVGIDPAAIMEGVQRSMRIVYFREIDKLERHLSFLATVGSISPYVGLFGTVWGIMTSFQALAQEKQATIAMVAPGISEALVATAIGLFAAIPAVIAYNHYANKVEGLLNHYSTFQEEFTSILHRQAYGSGSSAT
jgi:biopolymer transport protein TolQ